MTTTNPERHNIKGRIIITVGIIVAAGALGAFALTRSIGSVGTAEAQPTFRVRQGPLTISVVESGTVKSREQVSLKCEVEGQTTMIFLIPEGQNVKKGDLLVELDASQLEDSLTQQQISVDNAEASFIRAREDLAVTKNQAESDISKAELDYQFAQEDVTQYVEGLYPKERMEAETNITLAKEELERAVEKLKWSERLFDEKYISETERDADRLTKKRAELNHELAVASLKVLEDYTSKRKLAELESDVEQMQMALERVKLKANADIVQAEADLKAKETELRQQRTKFEKTEGQLSKTKIYAPRDGLVVYATSVQSGGRRWGREPLQEGQAVRERQELIYLPSAESMMAEIQIHESSLEKVSVGQLVRLEIDAQPGKAYTGRVSKIAPLPDAESAWLNPDLKEYPTEIHLDGSHPELRTGMSCQAEIVVQQYADAMYVPVQAVVRIGNEPTVYVRSGRGFEPRTIKIGLDNNSMVHVLSGLEPDEEVLLTPPLNAESKAETATDEQEPAPVPTESPAMAAPAAATSQPVEAGPSSPEMDGGEQGPGAFTPEQAEQMRKRFENMTPEEREAMRKRFENMTPEEREQMRRQRGGGRPGGGFGGQPGERPSGGPGGERGGRRGGESGGQPRERSGGGGDS